MIQRLLLAALVLAIARIAARRSGRRGALSGRNDGL